MLIYNGSWRGYSFAEDGSANYPEHGASNDISVFHIPGGDRNVIQVGGKKSVQLSLTVQCNGSTLNSFRGAVGTKGTLIYSGGTYNNVVLSDVASANRIISNLDRYRVVLNFWI